MIPTLADRHLPVNHHEPSNVLRGRKVFVTSRHDKPNDALETDPDHQGIARAYPITYEGSYERTREVKDIDHGAQAEGPP